MGILSVYCPTTTRPIPTGIHTDYKDLVRGWDRLINVDCPHCGGNHEVKVRDAFIADAISDDALRGLRDAQVQAMAEQLAGMTPMAKNRADNDAETARLAKRTNGKNSRQIAGDGRTGARRSGKSAEPERRPR